jgi:hypothetical protein
MRRLNITIDPETYEHARIAAFLTKRNISAIIRSALQEWFVKHKLISKKELILSKTDIDELKNILEQDDFMELKDAKKELGIK